MHSTCSLRIVTCSFTYKNTSLTLSQIMHSIKKDLPNQVGRAFTLADLEVRILDDPTF